MRTVIKIDNNFKVVPLKKKVAAYARVSSNKDEMLNSLSTQVNFYKDYISKNPKYEFAGVYVDEGITGTKDNRPEFKRLIADCKAGKIDLILIKSISRFARNTVTLLEVVRELKELNVDVYFEKENIHSISGDGELMLTILASFAQEESLSVSENCKWRIRNNFKQGLPSNFKIFGYNLKNYNLEIIPREAEIVKMIFNDYLNGMGKLAIAKKLNNLGIKTKYGKQWYESVIHKMLRNNTYTGEMTLQKSFKNNYIEKKKTKNNGELPTYNVKNSHEAIIDKDTFNKVQDEIKIRAGNHESNPTNKKYTFTSMIECGICGSYFKHKILNASTKYAKSGWICSTYNSLGKAYCCNKVIPDEILKNLIMQVLKLDIWNEDIFKEKIEKIIVMDKNVVILNLRDGTTIKKKWGYSK